MPSFSDIANRDQVIERVIQMETPGGTHRFTVALGLYINRVTGEPVRFDIADYLDEGESLDELDEADVATITMAVNWCNRIASWDMTGAVTRRDGTVLVPEGVPIPLDPRVVRYMPFWFLNAITIKIMEIVNPNRPSGRGSRGR